MNEQDGAKQEMLEALNKYHKKYREVRQRLTHCRTRHAAMLKLKNLEHAEAYQVDIQQHALDLRNLHGHIRLMTDMVNGLKKSA